MIKLLTTGYTSSRGVNMSKKNYKELNLATEVLVKDSVKDLNTEMDSMDESSLVSKGMEQFIGRLKVMKNKDMKPLLSDVYKNIY